MLGQPATRRLAACAPGLLLLLAWPAGMHSAEVAVVFASRTLASSPDSAARPGAIEKAESGRLLVREADGSTRVLVDALRPGAPAGTPVDVMDPDVSWDGMSIVFAGFSPAEQAWRIYEIGAHGGANVGLRQVTRSDRVLDLSRFGAAARVLEGYDDVDPCYLPDGRICFVSTRYPVVAPDGRQRGTNLYVVEASGVDLHRITTERFGGDTPAVDPRTGAVVYSRWWRSSIFRIDASGEKDEAPVEPGSPGYGGVVTEPPLDGQPMDPIRAEIAPEKFPGLNSWFLASIRPDGSGMSMLSGVGLDREGTQAWRPAFLADGAIAALFIPRTPFLGLPRGDGLRLVPRGAEAPAPLGGPQTFSLPADGTIAGFLYASAEALPDGRLLVSAALPASPRDYDLYVQRGRSTPVLLHQIPGSAELGGVALAPRPRPPVIRDQVASRFSDQPPRTVEEAFREGGRFTFLAENIFGNAPVGMPIATAPPVTNLTIDFFMNPQRTGTTEPDEPILVASKKIDPSGRVEVELPAGVPLFEVLRTPSGRIPIGRDGQIFHVGGHNFGTPGKTARCVGCHAGHSMQEVPLEPAWTNLASSARVMASSSRLIPLDPATNSLRVLQRPENLVDRQSAGSRTEWASATPAASLELRWPVPIRAREVVLHAPRPGNGTLGARNQTIRRLVLVILLGTARLEERVVTGGLSPSGTPVALDTSRPFDRLQVVIRQEDVEGTYEGQPGPAIAEIEVTARVAESSGPLAFLRGDANCDTSIHVSDSIAILGWLFLGGAPPCCQAAADPDGDGGVTLTDAIYVLNFLFLGGTEPVSPFPACGTGATTKLSCDGPTACSSG